MRSAVGADPLQPATARAATTRLQERIDPPQLDGTSGSARDLQCVFDVWFDPCELALTQRQQLFEFFDKGSGRLLVLGEAFAYRDERQIQRARPARFGVALVLQGRQQLFRLIARRADGTDKVLARSTQTERSIELYYIARTTSLHPHDPADRRDAAAVHEKEHIRPGRGDRTARGESHREATTRLRKAQRNEARARVERVRH